MAENEQCRLLTDGTQRLDGDWLEMILSSQLSMLLAILPLGLVGDFTRTGDCPIEVTGCEGIRTCKIPRDQGIIVTPSGRLSFV